MKTMPPYNRILKFILGGVTLFCVSWIVSVSEWHGRAGWSGGELGARSPPTMRTIVAYSEIKQAEMHKPLSITCDRLPATPKVPHLNYKWEWQESEQSLWQPVAGTNLMLYSAYYDSRLPQHYVRLLASFPGHFYPREKQLYCQTRLKINDSHNEIAVDVVAAKIQEIWYDKWNPNPKHVETPLLLSCPIPEPLHQSAIISVVTETCEDPANAFRVTASNIPTKYKKRFTICVKDLSYETDISQDIIEWIEINKILGIDKIDMYVDNVHENMAKVLEHYREIGFVNLYRVPKHHFLYDNLWQKRRDHIITYNDCLYRNINDSEFIIPIDLDEIIIPKFADTFSELVQRLVQKGWNTSKNSAALVRNVFFFDFMQNKFVRSNKNSNRDNIKNKMYVKRDDVRISDEQILGTNEVTDYTLLEENSAVNKYRHRCGVNMRVPRLARHTTRSAVISPKGAFTKSLMVTKQVLMAFNHYPLASIGSDQFPNNYWFAPFEEVQLNHYKESCNRTLVRDCIQYEMKTVEDDSALRFRTPLIKALANSPCVS